MPVRMRKLLTLSVVLIAVLAFSGAVSAQEGCPPTAEPSGCALIRLAPEGLEADYYVGEVLVASGGPGYVPVPAGTSTLVEVRNIRDAGAGYGDAYTYANTSASVWVSEGQTQAYWLWPQKVWVKGTLNLTCNIRNLTEPEDAACRVLVDDEELATMAAGERAAYYVDAGAHTLRVELTGEDADRWRDVFVERERTIGVGRTTYFTADFVKKGLLTLGVSRAGVTGDLYVNGELIASGADSARVWLEPYHNHTVEGMNFVDPAAGGAYRWRDAQTTVYITPARELRLTLYLRKETIDSSSPTMGDTAPTSVPLPTGEETAVVADYTGTYTVPANTIAIFRQGQAQGKIANRFSKVGDSETSEHQFLFPIADGIYDLGEYGYLAGVIDYFGGSFGRHSIASSPGMSVHNVLNPLYANPNICQRGESPLECEYRLHKPAFALVLVRTWNVDVYEKDFRELVEVSIANGVVPILSTQPHQTPPPWADEVKQNEVIWAMAAEYGVPLWDLNATTELLGYRGVCDGCGDHLTMPPEGKEAFFLEKYWDFGAVHRNLEALEVLHLMMNEVIEKS